MTAQLCEPAQTIKRPAYEFDKYVCLGAGPSVEAGTIPA